MDNDVTAALLCPNLTRHVRTWGVAFKAVVHLRCVRNNELKAALAGGATSDAAMQRLSCAFLGGETRAAKWTQEEESGNAPWEPRRLTANCCEEVGVMKASRPPLRKVTDDLRAASHAVSKPPL